MDALQQALLAADPYTALKKNRPSFWVDTITGLRDDIEELKGDGVYPF